MVPHERMAGSVPVWGRAETAQSQIEARFSDIEESSFKLGYSGNSGDSRASKPFGFADLLDMANPLHHIPIVGHVYRKMTGDAIKPVSQIVGGGVFGGPLGAAAGIVNVVVAQETGQGVVDHAVGYVTRGDKPVLRSAYASGGVDQPLREAEHLLDWDDPAVEAGAASEDDFSNALLAFVDLGASEELSDKVVARRGIVQTSYND